MKMREWIIATMALAAVLPALGPGESASAQTPGPAAAPKQLAVDNSRWQNQFGFPGSKNQITGLGASSKNLYASLYYNIPRIVGKRFIEGKLAYWDGGAWREMGASTNSEPAAFLNIGDDVVVCGGFDLVDGANIGGVAKWNETTLTWSALGTGVGPRRNVATYNSVNCGAIAALGGDIIIGGGFEAVDGIEAFNMARWNGATWSQEAFGVYDALHDELGSVYALGALADGRLVVGGNFTHVYLTTTDTSARAMPNIGIWDPVAKQFSPMGSGLSAPPSQILVAGNDVYVGGDFTRAGGVTVNGIARWDGAQWHALGTGLGNGAVETMAFRDGKLYIGGSFGAVNGRDAHRIARWDGTTWAGLDTTNSTSDNVTGIAITGDGAIYAAGEFRRMGGVEVDNIARWSEAEQRWHTLGRGLVDDGGVWAANVSTVYELPDGTILAAGDFGWAAGERINRMATWNPVTRRWAEWEHGANGSVFTIKRNGDLLYFGGGFTQIGGISAPYIATFNLKTGQWSPLGTGLDEPVYAIAFAPDGIVYVGGGFSATPNGAALLLALYNPVTQTWSGTPLGFDPRTGVGSYVYTPYIAALAADSDGVLIGGWFRLRKINGAFVQEPVPASLIYWNRKTGAVINFNEGPRLIGGSEGSIATLLTMPDGSFFVGGHFDRIGPGVAASNAARHTAAGWQPLGTGVRSADSYSPSVQDMKRLGDRLFVGGDFATAGNTTSENVAIWNIATSTWEPMGDGAWGADFESRRGVKSIAISANTVYVGGHFWFAGDGQASGFAAWDHNLAPVTPPNLNRKVFAPVIQR